MNSVLSYPARIKYGVNSSREPVFKEWVPVFTGNPGFPFSREWQKNTTTVFSAIRISQI